MKKQLPDIKKRLQSNGLYKIVALLVSVVIWSTTLTGRTDSVLIRSMELEFILRPQVVMAGDVPKNVRIKVSGPRASLKKFTQMSGVISVNLNDRGEGEHEITLEGDRVGLPPGLKVISAEPKKIKVKLVEMNKKLGS
jgi:YbbR domain-containing protein